MRQIFKIGCIWENVAKKAPNLPKIGCFLRKIGIVMGRDLTLSRYLYGQNRETCVAHPRQTWIREPRLPPPPGYYDFDVYAAFDDD